MRALVGASDGHDELDALSAQVESRHPLGPSAPDGDMGPAPAHMVQIVTTVADPAEVQAELAALYPGNLCVSPVEFSGPDLRAVVDRLHMPDGSWALDSDSLYADLANHVFADIPVLDEAAVARIGADADKVEVWALVLPSS